MYKLKSENDFYIKGRGRILTTYSPVSCARSSKAFIEKTGPFIEIDGTVYEIKGVEMFMPGYELGIGEPIGILVGDNNVVDL